MSKKFNWPVIGHKNVLNFLQQSIERKKLSHAYVFFGAPHLGKKSAAKYFTKTILCYGYHQPDIIPCQKCVHCRQFDDNIHPDLIIVKRIVDSKTDKLKKNISLEQIKEVKGRLSLSPFLKNYKVAIIEEADKLSLSAADALLKILEEPPRKTIFILLTSKLTALPQTIVSRCQKIKFLPLSFVEIYDYLVKDKQVKRNAALSLAAIIQGKPGLVDYFLDESNLKNYYQKIEDSLSLINRPVYQRFSLIESLLPKTLNSEQQKEVADAFLTQWETIFRDWLLFKNSPQNNTKPSVANSYLADKVLATSKKYQNSQLIKLLDKIKESKTYLNQNVSPKLILENFVLAF